MCRAIGRYLYVSKERAIQFSKKLYTKDQVRQQLNRSKTIPCDVFIHYGTVQFIMVKVFGRLPRRKYKPIGYQGLTKHTVFCKYLLQAMFTF